MTNTTAPGEPRKPASKRLPIGIIRKNKARLAAVQAIYSQDIAEKGDNPEELIEEFLQRFVEEQAEADEDEDGLVPDTKFFKKLLRGIYANREEVDRLVAEHLGTGWDMNRLGGVMRSLLRVGVAELLVFPQTPLKTIVNEYVSLGRGFFGEQEVGFVNGILDRIGHKVHTSR